LNSAALACAVVGALAGAPAVAPAPRSTPAPSSAISEPAPRPQPVARVQARFAEKDRRVLLFGGAEYLARGDYYNSPGLRLGADYYFLESLAVELQLSHYWSSLNDAAERVAATLGAVPDTRPPTWLGLVGARYSLGYGKILLGGGSGVIHLEPQAFAHAGIHDYGGDVQPSGDVGLGFLVFLTPRVFARADVAITLERESRSGQNVAVWGVLPAAILGGIL
jgi:outer membrane beta-barrel protein